ncbi:IS66 family transposase [Anoxybacteroides amylolyticum]|uniref:Transposase IS66 family protein n=1 Tax=Anoxybacteroides amylolyticum TaxID=294699 RepID=A0A160F5V3_9BACL|nr:IS66 family transposase [Anoxybacillus amylolyticus]ANB60766.1 transposase IS66 family protein [Anoxybacillus amylolyticus]ANB61153.1 transposase IS66 family protein [Anoxybacillus amylolyticus]ANB61944.1 transposase IS66 family protein [Anoxybacillus amylolyticus]
MANVVFDFQQAVFTLESMVAKIERQAQTIEKLIKENEQLRQENQQLRQENQKLKARIAELEARTKKNSTNSHLPPSSDRFVAKSPSRQPSEKQPGGQLGHRGTTLRQVPNPDHRVLHRVTKCKGCGHSLEHVAPLQVDIRQVFDLPVVRMEVTQHEREVKGCPKCHLVQQAEFPFYVTNHVQYGPAITSLVLYWNHAQLIPCERVTEMVKALVDHSISAGTVVNMTRRWLPVFKAALEEIEAALLASKTLHVDETSLRVNRKNQWVHVASTAKVTRYGLHRSRGKQATDDIGILPRYKGTMVHDAYSVYPMYTEASHALCHAHHLRELRAYTELYGHSWSKEMSEALLKMKQAVENAGGALPEEEVRYWEAVYDELLANGRRELEERCRQGKHEGVRNAQNFIQRLEKRKQEALLFLRKKEVPFDNNQAERDLRMVKVKQKISGTFRQEDDAEAFCVIRSVISTLQKHEKPAWESLQRLLSGESLQTILHSS